MDDNLCYVCRQGEDVGELVKATLKYYLEALSGHQQVVPVHKACKKGEVMIQTEQGIMWERK